MRTESNYDKEVKFKLWIRETSLTLSYFETGGFLPEMSYLSAFLVNQLRYSEIVIPKDKELGIVFNLRDQKGLIKCINTLIPPNSLDQVIVSLPNSKEFVLLNGSELDSQEINFKLKNIVFLPSGLIEILPKIREIHPLYKKYEWLENWELIKNNTCSIARKIFCNSYASSTNSEPQRDEESLRILTEDIELNHKALRNLIASGLKTKIAQSDGAHISPPADLEEIQQSDYIEKEDCIIIPGKHSYELFWKGKATRNKRNHHVDTRYENKKTHDNSVMQCEEFLSEDDYAKLDQNQSKKKLISNAIQLWELAPRRLSPIEREGVKDIFFRRWLNYELWNPSLIITRITDSILLRIWRTAYNMLKARCNKKLERRGIQFNEIIELTGRDVNSRAIFA